MINALRSLLKDETVTHNGVKENGRKHHKSHLQQITEDTAEKEGKDPDSTEKQLLHGIRAKKTGEELT